MFLLIYLLTSDLTGATSVSDAALMSFLGLTPQKSNPNNNNNNMFASLFQTPSQPQSPPPPPPAPVPAPSPKAGNQNAVNPFDQMLNEYIKNMFSRGNPMMAGGGGGQGQ